MKGQAVRGEEEGSRESTGALRDYITHREKKNCLRIKG